MIVIYYQTKTPIGFWCKRRLNSRSLIQPSETLLAKLTGINFLRMTLCNKKKIFLEDFCCLCNKKNVSTYLALYFNLSLG